MPDLSNRRPRLSLLSALLITACVAMGIGLWRSWQQTERFRVEASRALNENHRLREEYGEFDIADPDLLYAVMLHPDIDPDNDRDWAWRIATPAGKRVALNYADGLIASLQTLKSQPALPKPAYREVLEPGVHTIRLSFDYNPKFPPAKAWQWRLAIRSYLGDRNSRRSTSRSMSAPAWPSLIDDSGPLAALLHRDEGVGWGLHPPSVTDNGYFPDRPLVLQRMRVQTVDRKRLPPQGLSSYSEIPNFDPQATATGFIVWLEPVP